MDLGWIATVASPSDPAVQVTIISNDDMAAPGISVGVADVDAVHAKAVEQGFEIAYPLRDEEWGVRRFMLREPSGTVVDVVCAPLLTGNWATAHCAQASAVLRSGTATGRATRLMKTQQIKIFDAEAAASVTTATTNHHRGRSGAASGRARPAEPTQHRITAAI